MITDIEFNYQVISKVARGLSRIHKYQAQDGFSELTLSDSTRQDAMRIDKHHDNIKEKYPELASRVQSSVKNLLEDCQHLVHGDYSPKNILVDHQSSRLWILDFEFTHIGSPVFDLAYIINYLFLVECVHGYHHDYSFDLIDVFWEKYNNKFYDKSYLERTLITELPIRILTRLDGVHPITWVSQELKEAISSFVMSIIDSEITTIEQFIKMARSHFCEYK